jgi:predicted HicB family RNase H-like nuclease
MPKREAEEVPVTIRFPKEVHKAAADEAKADDRTLNSVVVRAVRAYVEAQGAERKTR